MRHTISDGNSTVSRRWHVCGECHKKVYVGKAQSWRSARARCMSCGSTRLYTPEEAKELGISVKKK